MSLTVLSAQELFGPLSLRALEEDMYVRQIKGYLPDASVAFIDEVRRHCESPLHLERCALSFCRTGVQGQQRSVELAAHDS